VTLVVDLHYLEMDQDLASEQEWGRWWSAEWGPDGDPDTEDSSPYLTEVVESVVESARDRGVPAESIDWRLHQAPGDPCITSALDTTEVALPGHP
jgi:hypothetical protein